MIVQILPWLMLIMNSKQLSSITPPRTFYRRQLPSHIISFSSEHGRHVFARALGNGGTSSFFPLIEQLQTQPEPAFCGLTTLVIVLNALAIDPRRSWKGPWRWYTETMLNCCVDLEQVKQTGITFTTFACLAKCQGLDVRTIFGSNSTVDEFRMVVKEQTSCSSSSSSSTRPTSFLIVSYDRSVVGQTGTGHFSPIGAYDETSDHVLVLDTARFKYGPHWIPLPLLFEAMLPIDPDSGKSRGYVVLGYDHDVVTNDRRNDDTESGNASLSHLPLSILFGSKKSKDVIRREYKEYLQQHHHSNEQGGITLESVISFWTKHDMNNDYIWQLVEPQLQPVDASDIAMVSSLRTLIQQLIQLNDYASNIPQHLLSTSRERNAYTPGGECCNSSSTTRRANNERVLEISPAEVMFVVYLASLPVDVRREIVFAKKNKENNNSKSEDGDEEVDDDATTKEQLLAEAALISYAIETCDADI